MRGTITHDTGLPAYSFNPCGKSLEMGSENIAMEFHMGHFPKLTAVIASAHFIQFHTGSVPCEH